MVIYLLVEEAPQNQKGRKVKETREDFFPFSIRKVAAASSPKCYYELGRNYQL